MKKEKQTIEELSEEANALLADEPFNQIAPEAKAPVDDKLRPQMPSGLPPQAAAGMPIAGERPGLEDAATQLRFSEFNVSMVGGMAGGVIGMAAGGPPVALIGSALGAEGFRRGALAANEALDWMSGDEDAVLGIAPPEKMLSEAIDSASIIYADMATGGLGSEIGRAWSALPDFIRNGKAAVGEMAPSELYSLMNKMRIKSNSMITGSPFVRKVYQGLSRLPTSARVMQEAIAETYEGIERYVKETGEKIFFGGTSLEQATKGVQKGLKNWSAKAQNMAEHEMSKIFKMGVSEKDHIPMENTLEYLKSRKSSMQYAQDTQEYVFPPELNAVLNDIQREVLVDQPGMRSKIIKKLSGELPWEVVQAFRSKEGFSIRGSNGREVNHKAIAGLYSVLSADMEAAAAKKGGDVLRQYLKAKNIYRTVQQRKKELYNIMDAEDTKKAFNGIMNGSKFGTQQLKKVKNLVMRVGGAEPESGRLGIPREDFEKLIPGSDVWDEFVAANFQKFGLAPPGHQTGVNANEFSINTFLKNYSGLKQSGALDVLFSSPKLKKVKPHMEDLVKVMSEIKGLDQYVNWSRTAEQMVVMQGAVSGAGAFAGYNILGPAGLILGPMATLGTPWGLGKLLTNEKFVKFLVKGAKSSAPELQSAARSAKYWKDVGQLPDAPKRMSSADQISRGVARYMTKALTDIVEDDPSMAGPVKTYLERQAALNEQINKMRSGQLPPTSNIR